MADQKSIEDMTFKEASIELEQIVRSLEAGDLELEESLERYGRGVELLRSLRERLSNAEQKVRVLLDEAGETAVTTDTASAPSTAYLDVRLAKAESLTDWSRRPLDPEQLTYAEDDVRYLPGIYERMVSELIERDRLAWVAPEMEALTDPAHVTRPPEEAYLRLKRSGSLTRRQLAVAREACAWRERLAAARDVPRKWVLSDEVIVEVCKRVPRGTDRLRRIRGTERGQDRGPRPGPRRRERHARGASCQRRTLRKDVGRLRAGGKLEGFRHGCRCRRGRRRSEGRRGLDAHLI